MKGKNTVVRKTEIRARGWYKYPSAEGTRTILACDRRALLRTYSGGHRGEVYQAQEHQSSNAFSG